MPLLPLFPLPNVVLFPGVPMPLHIFEPRYRAMVADALEGDRRLGMVLLQPGWESDYEGRPAIYPIGCSGVIVSAAKLDDGRYNLVLHGLERIRIVEEDHAKSYRRAVVEASSDPPLDDAGQAAVRDRRTRIEAIVGFGDHADSPEAVTAAERLKVMPDADFIHVLAHGLNLEPVEKQALLECDSLPSRAQALVDLLEMRRLSATIPDSDRRLQ